MNLLKQHIVEIKHEQKSEAEWTTLMKDLEFIDATVVINCYGQKEEKEITMERKRWESAKEQGYWMA